jgi:hypothetical protein
MKKAMGSLVRAGAILFAAVAAGTFIWGCERDTNGSSTPSESPAPNGYALAIGLNKVDPVHYGGPVQELSGCEPDAMDMKGIAISQGLEVEVLLTEAATRDAVLGKLSALAGKLKPADLLVVSYSGHGGNVPDQNGDEADGLDETWCLYDGQLLDDELYGALMKFQAGVRILVFSDSCHSGTVLKMTKQDTESALPTRTHELDTMWAKVRVPPKLDRQKMLSLPEMRRAVPMQPYLKEHIRSLPPAVRQPGESTPFALATPEAEQVFVSRSMPPGVWAKTYQQNRSFYDALGKAAPRQDSDQVKAAVILISACDDPQTAADIGFNGLFTWMLKKVWNTGAYAGDHQKFYEDIRDRVTQENPDQVPTFRYIGAFVGQRPYTVK